MQANIIYKCSGCSSEYSSEYDCFECIACCNTPRTYEWAEIEPLIRKHYNPLANPKYVESLINAVAFDLVAL